VRVSIRHLSIALALAAASLFSASARAVSVVYTEVSNTGTVRVQNSSPFSITDTPYANPYASVSVTQQGSNFLLTFVPNLLFTATATNAGGAQTVDNSGKIDFNLQFDAPVQLSALINEGGSFSTTGTGMAGIFAGGTITAIAPDNTQPEQLINGNLQMSFNPDNTWNGTVAMGSMVGLYSKYHFAIDNDLFAYAFAGTSLNTASLAKQSFSILIGTTPPDVGATPVPLPSAAGAGFSMLALGAAAYVLKRQCKKPAIG
jgi:hypothetical protein